LSDRPRIDALSPRELEIAQAYAEGASYREIAEQLFVAPTTIRTHLRNIYEKLGISNKASLFSLLATTSENARDAVQGGGVDGVARKITNLPTVRYRLIGREEQLHAIRDQLLNDEVGMVTLTGPGGSGKTRLGLAVAAELTEHFAGRVYFVDLAPIRDPELAMSAIAQTMGLREAGPRSPLESLKDYLRDRSVLLVLDNFEQILPAAVMVAELLASCAELKVLVTSRAALQIREEREVLVPPLALPNPRLAKTAETLSDCASVALLVERAAAVRSDFVLSDENAGDLAEICIRLDGLPLALELAAARLRSLDPKEMLARLERRLPLLVGGARDLPSRQQTLRAAITWSYDLLSPAEQDLLHCLSVFVGGCSLEAIEAVCSSTEMDGAESHRLLDQIDLLLANHFLQQIDGVDGDPRFLMMEMLREFGSERLHAEGKAASMQSRHAKYFLRLAEQADPHLRGGRQLEWLDRLEADHANLRAAITWSLEPREHAELGLRIATVLAWFWRLRGYLREGRNRLEALLGACPDRTLLRSRALARTVLLIDSLGDYDSALSLGEESLAIASQVENDSAIAWALHAMGRVLHSSGNYERAGEVLEQSLTRFKADADVVGCAYSSWFLGNVMREKAEYGKAAQWFAEALGFARQADDTWAIASTIMQAGSLANLQQDMDRASALLKESLSYFQDLRAPWGMWFPLSRLVAVAAKQGYAKRAVQLAGAQAAMQSEIGAVMSSNHLSEYETGLAIARQALSEPAFASAFAMGKAMSTDEAAQYALSSEDEM